jgi:nucleotide-binding universal stress UspA family protein
MFRNLFVPVDGSELTERAMQTSIDLARQLGASVTGFVVEPDVPLPNLGSQMQQYERDAQAHIERTDSHAQALLSAFEAKATEAGVAFRGVSARANGIDQAIVDQANIAGADLIVMATHGRGLLGELLHGSHTKNVLAGSKLPLLVVR